MTQWEEEEKADSKVKYNGKREAAKDKLQYFRAQSWPGPLLEH